MNYFAHDDKSHWSKKERNMFDHLISQRRLLPVFEGRTVPGIQPLEAVLDYNAVRKDLDQLETALWASMLNAQKRLDKLEQTVSVFPVTEPTLFRSGEWCRYCGTEIGKRGMSNVWYHTATSSISCGTVARP